MCASYDFTTVIPTKDRPLHAAAAVQRMLAQVRRPLRIVVVDASTPPWRPDPQLVADAEGAGVEFEVLYDSPSTAGQRNRGLERVETPLVFFLDDDVEIDDQYASELLSRWEREGSSRLGGVVGSRIHPSGHRLSRIGRRLFMLHVSEPDRYGTELRASGKLRYVDRPQREVMIDAVGTNAVMYRSDLARKHLFDERFPGYALGEDIDMSQRLAKEAPILQVPDALYADIEADASGGRKSTSRWYYRGRRETYFRLKHISHDPVRLGAFAVSIVGETLAAAWDTARERDPVHVSNFVVGVTRTLSEAYAVRLRSRTSQAASHGYDRARLSANRLSGSRAATATWAGVRVIGYRNVTPVRDVSAISPDAFRRQIEVALQLGLVPVGSVEAADELTRTTGRRAFWVTFDGGYGEVLDHAVPVLTELRVPATFFVASKVIDGVVSTPWHVNGRRAARWDELRDLVKNPAFDVQAHGRRQSALTRLTDEEAYDEIVGSKSDLEERLGTTAIAFSFPEGSYGPRDVALLREAGYRHGVTQDPGVATANSVAEALPRTMITAWDDLDDFRSKMIGLLDRPTRHASVAARRSGSAPTARP